MKWVQIRRVASLLAVAVATSAQIPAPTPAPVPARPNVVIILFDDAGFADIGAFGSEIRTPNIDRLAANGLRFTRFHTTGLCSPSRAALLTGRNHHTVGVRTLTNFATGAPNNLGRITDAAATLAEVLRDNNYSTFAVGKWHLNPPSESSSAGPFNDWPLGRGFERYYGFLDGGTDQFYPELVEDNRLVSPPTDPQHGYHLTEDLVSRSIDLVKNQQTLRPDKNFFLYLSLSAPHAPHQAPAEYLARNKGRFDRGWDVIRAERLERMKKMGLVPPGTDLAPRATGVKAWAEMSADERRVNARFQEAYAAFMEHTDDQIGRLMSFLEERKLVDNTVIFLLSDNGASQEGGLLGTTNLMTWPNAVPPTLEQNVAHIDDIGTMDAHPNYPLGWAQVSNTPFQRFKQNVHFGGVRDPLIVQWPARIKDRGGIRTQFHHLIDVMPTVLDLVGVKAPTKYKGVDQLPIAGVSMAYTFDAPRAPGRRQTQYFEMYGHRGIYHNGWKAVTFHVKGMPFESDKWELYNIDEDFSETHDLAASNPAKLRELIRVWEQEAKKFGVLPLDDRTFELRLLPRPGAAPARTSFTFFNGMPDLPSSLAPDIKNKSYSIQASIDRRGAAAEGVIVAHGDVDGGYVLYVKGNRLVHEYKFVGTTYTVSSAAVLPTGKSVVRFDFVKTGEYTGLGRLSINGKQVAEAPIPRTVTNVISFSPFSVGRDSLSPVSTAYVGKGEFPFEGTLESVTIDLAEADRRD